MRIQSTTTGCAVYNREFQEYLRLNLRNVNDLVIEGGRKLATDLFVETDRLITPSRERIAATVKALGWRVIKRGTPAQWKGAAFAKREKKRGRGAGALNDAARERAMAKKTTLAQMQAFVIKKRSDARQYLATGWLGAVSDLGGSMKVRSGKVNSLRGRAEITLTRGAPRVVLVNDTPGIVTMNRKANFVRAAFQRRAADLRTYNARKRMEAQQRVFRSARRLAA